MNLIKEIRLTRVEKRLVRSTPQSDGTWQDTYADTKIGTVGVIRSNTYYKGIDHIKNMVDAARSDFPHLTDKDIRLVHFGGDRYKGTMGIAFDLPDLLVPPPGYTPINELEQLK